MTGGILRGFDIYPTNQNIPNGYERILDRRDRDGAEELLDQLRSGGLICFELREEDGQIYAVEAADWRTSFGPSMLEIGYKQHWFAPQNPDSPGAPREAYSYGQTWNVLMVKTISHDVDVVSAMPVLSKNGGRPPKYNWDRIWRRIVRIANTPDGLPPRPELIRQLQDWMTETNQPEVGETTLKDKLRPIYDNIDE